MNEEQEAVDTPFEVVNDIEPQIEPEDDFNPTEKRQLDLATMKGGYVVGLNDEGEVLFDVFGTNTNQMEVMGLHYHAGRSLGRRYEDMTLMGDRLTHEVGKAVALLTAKVNEMEEKIERLAGMMALLKVDKGE
jgi:hypothetical protein